MKFRKDHFISRRKSDLFELRIGWLPAVLISSAFPVLINLAQFSLHIGYFDAGGELDTAVLSLQVCLQERKLKYELSKVVH